jgi:CubicO group peptidase (beta-lactamase class C family)
VAVLQSSGPRAWSLAAAVLALALGGCARSPARNLAEFRWRLERHREDWGIPGFAAAVVRDGEVVWARGFGFADLAWRQPAEPHTVYHLASLTKTFAAAVVLLLAEEGKLGLDDPVVKYEVEMENAGEVTVRHLLSHTSKGVPGTRFQYDGARFGKLDQVIAAASGRSFGELLVERILRPIELRDTAPNPEDAAAFALTGLDREDFRHRLATGYASDGFTRVAYPQYFGAAAGLVSTAVDMAHWAIAILAGRVLRPESWALAFTPAASPDGKRFPYGLGWFVQEERGVKLVWHYGLWTGNSSTIVLVPDRGLAFVALANSDMLTRKFDMWMDGDVLHSPFAREFVEAFVFGDLSMAGGAGGKP